MSDIDILLTEAETAIEAAGARFRNARTAAGIGVGEIEGAGADLYDAGIDLVIELRQLFGTNS